MILDHLGSYDISILPDNDLVMKSKGAAYPLFHCDNSECTKMKETEIKEKMMLINMLSADKQVILVTNDPSYFSWIIEPDQVVKNAMDFKKL